MTIHADDPLFLRLAFTRGVSARVAHKLLSELGDINTLFAASTSTIAGIAGDAVARALTTAPDGTAASLIDAALAWLNEAEDQHLLTWAHPAFPALLLESGDAPVILFAKGRLDLLERPALAMVGLVRPMRYISSARASTLPAARMSRAQLRRATWLGVVSASA